MNYTIRAYLIFASSTSPYRMIFPGLLEQRALVVSETLEPQLDVNLHAPSHVRSPLLE
jgi:hypothetical protein